jgi:uncharacterized repeat protein (TIGR01451 family)
MGISGLRSWAVGAVVSVLVVSGAAMVPVAAATQAGHPTRDGHAIRVVHAIRVLHATRPASATRAWHAARPLHEVPGNPGTAQPPTPLFTEDFSFEDATHAGIALPSYTGAPGTAYVPGVSGASSETYTGSPNWAGTYCDGWILNASSPLPAPSSNCTNADWTPLKVLTQALGTFQGMTASAAAANQALSEYTDGNPGPGVMFQTVSPIPAIAGHFYQVTAIFGAENCPNGATKPSLTFSLLVNGTVTPVGTNLDPCTDPSAVAIGGTKVASLKSSALQVTGASPTLGLQLYNAQGSGGGNDAAFDLPQIMDVTPQLDKSFSPGTVTAGGVSALTFTVTNTDELAAKNGWGFTDDLPTGLTATGVNSTTCPSGTVSAVAGASSLVVSGNLNAGEVSCSVTVQVTAPAAGTYTNGPGNFPAGTAGLNGLNPPGEATLTVTAPLSLVIAKQSLTTALPAAGATVFYKFVVTNRSKVPLTNVSVADTQDPPASQANMSPVTCAVTVLAPGESTTCTGTYTVTQADVDNGSLMDSVTASGTPPSGPVVTTPPSVLVIGPPAPAVTVVKSTTVTEATAVGQLVPYAFLVTNTGNVTLDGVTVSDTQEPPATPGNMSPVSCPQPDLAAGDSETCTGTYTVTQADLDNGTIADQAVASATAPDGSAVTSPPSQLSVPAQPPGALSVQKATTTTAVTAVGQVIPYTFLVKNNSSGTVNGISVTDTVSPPSLPGNLSAVTCPQGSLAAGASMTCTATYQVTLADVNEGQVSDTAHADGTDASGNPVHSGQSTVTLTAPTATISLVKAATVASVASVGGHIPYTFTVTNTGNQPLTGVSVTDTQVAPASPGSMSPVTCPGTTLAAGASETCTGTYTVTQADLDNGSINDYAVANATGPSGAVQSPQSSASVPVQSPPLTMVKSSSDDTYDQVGQQVGYQFTVTNLSTVTFTGIAVQDTQQPPATQNGLSAVSCPQPDLAAGESETCTATYTVTVTDLDHGTLADAATATGVDSANGQTVTTPSSSIILPATQSPAVTVVKSSTTAAVTHAGQVVPYSFLVINTGNVTLDHVAVTDTVTAPSDPANLSPVTCPDMTLAPGASTTCTASYTVTQADVDHGGPVADSATVTGTPPATPADPSPVPLPPSSPPSTTSVPVTQSRAMSVVKSSTTAAVTQAGQVVPYSFLVTNTGNVTLDHVAVTDTVTAPSDPLNLSPVTCLDTTLAPGASTTCTASYTVTQADLDHGSVNDSATVTGTPPATPADPSPVPLPPSPASPFSVPVTQSPALSVVKSAPSAEVHAAGDVIGYAFLVTNTGNVTLDHVAVSDTVAAPSDPANLSPVTCPDTTLAPGASTTCTATYTVTQADIDHGSVIDSATASGTPPSGPPVTSPPSAASVPSPASPGINIVKSATPAQVHAAGQVITYRFTVTDTGNDTLHDVTVTDSQAAPAGSLDGPITCPDTTLAPGASVTCTATYTVTQADIDNGGVSDSATATGTPPSGPAVTSAPAPLPVPAPQAPAITVIKSAPPAPVTHAGQQVWYSFLVSDTGNVTLRHITVTDTVAPPSDPANLSPVTCPDTTLAPGASERCTATYTVTQADVDHGGTLRDTATVTGTPPPTTGNPSPPPLQGSPPSGASVPVAQAPALRVAKSTTTATVTHAGQRVRYSFLVTDTGNVTMRDVKVTDTVAAPSDPADLSPVTCPQPTLAPGASETCTATYTVTQADLDHGRLADSATVTGTPPATVADPHPAPLPPSPPSAASVRVAQAPGLRIVKSAATEQVTGDPAEVIRYQFTLANTGNLTLTHVAVSDPLLAAAGITVRCPHPVLAPGKSETCAPARPYTVTSADAARGTVTNTADAHARTPSGHLIRSRPSTVTVKVSFLAVIIPTGEGASAPPAGASPALAAAGAALLAAGTLLLITLLLGRRPRRRSA